MLVFVKIVKQIRLFVVPADAKVRRGEDFPELVADEVDDVLEIQFGGEPLLDRIDDPELGGALLLGLEQALRLVEQARVLERDAHRVGKRRQQAYVRVRKRVRLQLAYGDHAMGGIATKPWRMSAVEQRLTGAAVDEATIRDAARLAVRDAKPQSENGFKVELAQRCLAHALRLATGLASI